MQLRPAYPILTPRLSLRPLTIADIDDLLAYRGRADVCRYLPFEPMTRDVLVERLSPGGRLAPVEITDQGQALTLGVWTRESPRLIGDVVLFFHSREHAGGELGYVFHPDAGGHGYATEACAVVLSLAFEQLGLHRVVARIDARNDSSARLAARLGMRLEAHLVRNELFKGEWADELDYAMLAEEWPAVRPTR